MIFNLIRFACFKTDIPEYLALTDKQYDSYIIGEYGHPEGKYHIFEFLGDVRLTPETVKEAVANICLKNTEPK